MKTAFLFSGQGSQYVGMGKELYETYPCAKDVFDQIVMDFDVQKLCFEGPKEELDDTQFAQVCIFAVSMMAAAVLKEKGIQGDVCAGLSLGEYSALCYGNAFSIKEGAQLLRERGKLMASALPAGMTTMAAVLMLDEANIKAACDEVKEIGICEIANYNCPGQIVITGEKDAVTACGEKCLERGARRVIPLQVSGAFHSSLLNEASNQLHDCLAKVDMHSSDVPIYHNVSGQQEDGAIIDLLTKQIKQSVLFEQTIQHMLEDGVTDFIEVGPGTAILGFVKKCTKGLDVHISHVEDMASLEAVITAWKG